MSDLPEGFRPVWPQAGALQPQTATQDVGLPEGFFPAAEPSMSLGDMGRFGMTAAVRGLTGLPDALADPLAPLRRLVSPDLERLEQSGVVHPGQAAGNAIFSATGVPEYQPTTPGGRVGMSAAQGGIAGAPFGALGALIGALGGTTGQVTQEATGNERLATLAGLVPGGAIAGMGSRAISRMTPDLEAAGINPTLGQAMGGTLNRIEQGLASFPFVGDFMKFGRAGATEQFNRGAINNFALAPIGEQLDKGTPLGRPAINEMRTKIGNAYDTATAQLGDTSLRTPEFGTGLNDILQNRSGLSPVHSDLFDHTYRTEVLRRMDNNGALSGQDFRDIDSTLGQLGTGHLSSPIPADRAFGNLVMDLRDQIRGQVQRSNPDVAAQLDKINQAYKYAERISRASTRMGTGLQGQSEPGVFTPSQLISASSEMDPTLRHHAFASGNAVLQDYAEAGRRLLGDTVPDSGTATRAIIGLGAGFGGGKAAAAYGLLDPATVATLALGTGATGLAYSPAGRAAMNYFLRRPEQSAAVGLLTNPDERP